MNDYIRVVRIVTNCNFRNLGDTLKILCVSCIDPDVIFHLLDKFQLWINSVGSAIFLGLKHQ